MPDTTTTAVIIICTAVALFVTGLGILVCLLNKKGKENGEVYVINASIQRKGRRRSIYFTLEPLDSNLDTDANTDANMEVDKTVEDLSKHEDSQMNESSDMTFSSD